MPTVAQVIAEARSWIDTPYRHHGRTKGKVCDCVGLVVGVGESIGLDLYPRFDYSSHPKAEKLLRECAAVLEEQPEGTLPQPGMVAAMVVRKGLEPQHLGVVAEYDGRLTLVHAFQKFERVSEHSLTKWWSQRIVKLYRYPGVDY